MTDQGALDLVTVVIQQKLERGVVDAALAAGAPGATYFYGRGTGVRQRLGIFGHLIEAEKLVILMAVPTDKTDSVVQAVRKAASLDKPGNGFMYVQRIAQVVGFS